ncbi:unnamed protein product [Cercopithifilaria johnstoni]|uniref:Chitin-binding type-2 domain-containing protein n=1 Tax=Cercopithifilaria johnstoni TaxID=2874296 RepID=A0A8J2MAX2_9BILA|nr:unnamed protein product [Cercopithifilaria johnstoni]
MSITILFIFFEIVNVQSEREYQAIVNARQNPYHSQNSQSFQQSRDDGALSVISGYQQSIDRYDPTTTTACNPGDIAPTGDDCAAFYECINGHYKLRFCPSNTFFNPTLKRCHANYVCPKRTYESPTSPLPPCKYGELRADATSCRNYYSCADNDRHFERRVCPDGKIFNRTLNRCVSHAAGNKCQQSIQHDFESRNIAMGLACTESSDSSGYNADPTDCRRYYQCAQGRWIRMQCPSNLVWNPAATVCDWPKNTLLSCH